MLDYCVLAGINNSFTNKSFELLFFCYIYAASSDAFLKNNYILLILYYIHYGKTEADRRVCT